MKFTYKLTYLQACCLRDFLLKITGQVNPAPDELLAQQVLAAYAIKLNNRLVYQYAKTRSITLPLTASLSLVVLCKKFYFENYSIQELSVVQPIVADIKRHLVNLRTITP